MVAESYVRVTRPTVVATISRQRLGVCSALNEEVIRHLYGAFEELACEGPRASLEEGSQAVVERRPCARPFPCHCDVGCLRYN